MPAPLLLSLPLPVPLPLPSSLGGGVGRGGGVRLGQQQPMLTQVGAATYVGAVARSLELHKWFVIMMLQTNGIRMHILRSAGAFVVAVAG